MNESGSNQLTTPLKVLEETGVSVSPHKNENEPLLEVNLESKADDDVSNYLKIIKHNLPTSTPAKIDESSNDSTTLQIVLPSSARKRKPRNCDINKEIEDHIEEELAKKPRKNSLTVKKVKNILKYVIGNESVLAMVSSAMKDDGEDLEIEPKLTRSKTRQLRKENQIMWPLSPIQIPKTADTEHLVLIREELPEEEDDDEYRPTIADLQEHSDDESGRHSSLNVSSASRYLANFDPDLLDEVAQDAPVAAPIPMIPEPNFAFKQPVENIGQRTRSKFSLSSTPLEAIEQAFIPPDITTDMYDFHCDNLDWENFLKEFMQPLSNDAADVDEEDDPEYNVIEDEELDKEELRRDSAVTVPRSELKTLMMELLEGIDDFSSDDDITKPVIRETTKEPETELITLKPRSPSPQPQATEPEEPLIIGLSLQQRNLLLQQMRQHVQLLTQNFLQTYAHPLFNLFAAKSKEMLVQLVTLSDLNPNSAVNVFNLHKAVSLSDYWENLLSSTATGSEIIRFLENETDAAKKAKKMKRFHTLTFHPHLIQLIMQSNVFLYPSLLPTQPFRCDLPIRSEFIESENRLIAIGLEQFIPHVEKNSEWYDGRQGIDRLAADLIHEHILPAKSTMQLYTRIRKFKKIKGNPIWYYFTHNKTEKTTHNILLFDYSNVVAPKDLKPDLLHSCWKQYALDNTKEKNNN